MSQSDAIVNPYRGRNVPSIGPAAVMVSNGQDLRSVVSLAGLGEKDGTDLYMSRLYREADVPQPLAVVGPYIGAPYGVMLLETLIAWGASRVVIFGWCGAVSPNVKTGDVVLPTGAHIDEGTSVHYRMGADPVAVPSAPLTERIAAALENRDCAFHRGEIWTTDAIYRETRERVAHFQEKQVLAVEMEVSALFSVGHFRGVDVAAVLVVSDELSSFEWRPGFGARKFKDSRRAICELLPWIA